VAAKGRLHGRAAALLLLCGWTFLFLFYINAAKISCLIVLLFSLGLLLTVSVYEKLGTSVHVTVKSIKSLKRATTLDCINICPIFYIPCYKLAVHVFRYSVSNFCCTVFLSVGWRGMGLRALLAF